jgi:hypothetical protein
MFFLDFFCGGIVSCSSVETRWAPMLGGIRKTGRDPQTRERDGIVSAFKSSNNAIGDWESPTSGTDFQSNGSVYTCPRTPLL